ncbi:MAG: hypothetical protein A2V87_09550 [Deltaproteobacteria bacterium RBG_16_58_17]|nr:MAG: hypothetical protein A2V87_09550 [Deltaproteobacteria bacterium RBG_16_58_17]OHE17694.1 MAG: hypothetical protein A2X96_07570 [Syntrophobacterales bacterium GWC2_56_13]OHE20000.1 MAG: hypothetical protein A2X95_03265 [Syntrophobacterales bacterium GWF2_56_9]
MMKAWGAAALAILLLGFFGCGGLRYSHVSPEAKDFHPRRIAVLPADVKTFPEAKGSIDSLISEALSERKWFAAVVGGEEVGRRLETDETLRQAVAEYLAKLDKVSFSDPALSGRIGELTRAEAFVLVRVDYWNYTKENDKKVGKVSLSLTLIEAGTGKIVWTAGHQRASDYLIMKPALPDVARDIIREMIDYMPH